MNSDWINEIVKQSIENWVNYLHAKKEEWSGTDSGPKKNSIIAELIQIEPSHIKVPWIADEVEKWLSDPEKYSNYLDSFSSKKQRGKRATEKRTSASEGHLWAVKINKISQRNNCTKKEAIKKYVLESCIASLPPGEQSEEAIRKRIDRFKSYKLERRLPYPYFGADVILKSDEVIIAIPHARFELPDDDFDMVSTSPACFHKPITQKASKALRSNIKMLMDAV